MGSDSVARAMEQGCTDISCQESVELESMIARKTEEAGKVLDAKEEEYVRLQVERNQLPQLYPHSESRAEEVLKRIQKLAKGRPKDDFLKIPFKSTQPKPDAERKSAERRNKSLEAREREREDDRKRKASPENMEKTKRRMKTPENMEKTRQRLRAPEQMEKTRQRLRAP